MGQQRRRDHSARRAGSGEVHIASWDNRALTRPPKRAILSGMTRVQLLAAEIFAYSFDNYANHLGIGHHRFEKYMPHDARLLERAEKESWSDERVAKALELDVAEVPAWRKRYREAVEVVDAPNVAEAFRNGVRQSLIRELQRHQLSDAEVEIVVKQICYRAADLSYLLDQRHEKLSDYSQELRRED
jgi:hypothetical protein